MVIVVQYVCMYSPCLFRLRLLLAYIASLTLKSWLCKKSAYSSNPSLVLQRRWKSLSFQRGLQKKHPALLYHLDSQFCTYYELKVCFMISRLFKFLIAIHTLICPIRGENMSLFNLKVKHTDTIPLSAFTISPYLYSY